MTQIGIIGGGAWGTALAQVYASAGRETLLWAREPEVVSSINTKHENEIFLPGVKLHESLKATSDLKEIANSGLLLLVTPTQHLRSILNNLSASRGASALSNKALIICCKGVEISSGLLPSQIARESAPGARIAVLTGPTFASEIARGLPAAVTLAAEDETFARETQAALSTPSFRAYASPDVIGAQVGAAIKNVIAIACGVAHGKALGESARAAIISRGLAEMARLAKAMGGRPETLMGLCGVGDLTLTCSSMQSRNFSLGAEMGAGKSAAEILSNRKSVTEGVYTARAALELAQKCGVDMPIVRAVHSCVNEGLSVDAAMKEMLNRPLNTENWR